MVADPKNLEICLHNEVHESFIRRRFGHWVCYGEYCLDCESTRTRKLNGWRRGAWSPWIRVTSTITIRDERSGA
jgi:hypothetical protein